MSKEKVPRKFLLLRLNLLTDDFMPDDTLDAMKKNLSREKQQSWNRGCSEVLGDDHKKARVAIRRSLSLDITIGAKKIANLTLFHLELFFAN